MRPSLNLAARDHPGYRTTPLRMGDEGHNELGGFTNATFDLMAI
jgi:hypothetical protein